MLDVDDLVAIDQAVCPIWRLQLLLADQFIGEAKHCKNTANHSAIQERTTSAVCSSAAYTR